MNKAQYSLSTMQQFIVSRYLKPHLKAVHVFSCNLPPALLAEWLGSFTHYSGNTGVEGIKSQQIVDPGEENYPTAEVGIQTWDLSIMSLTF